MKRGFTLIELLISMLILAALATFTIPTYQLILTQLQLNSAAEQVADTIRLSSQKTVTEQMVYGVRLNAGATTIPQVRIENDGSATVTGTYNLPANTIIDTVDFSGATEIHFSTAGAPNYSGTLTIRDTVRNRRRTIEVRPSGNIRTSATEF